jgi:Protein of unknown function (DUF3592)
MKVVLETPTQLVVHEGALRTVVIGAMFMALGGGSITLWVADPGGWTGTGGPWVIVLTGGVFAVAGLLLLVFSADRRIELDRASGTARLLVRRLLHRAATVYRLAELRDVVLERSGGAGARPSTPFYRIAFLTSSGGRVPWTPYSTTDEGTLATCASAVRAFCGWAGTGSEGTGLTARSSGSQAAPATGGSVSGHPVATNWGCLGAVLALFVAVGLGALGAELYRVATWQPVSARVLSSAIKAVRGNRGTSYAPVVRYQYSIDGTPYESDAVLPLNVSASLGWAERLRARFRPGDVVTAYVNPHRASSAFLVRQVSLLPLVFVALPVTIALILAWVSVVQRRQLAAREQHPVPMVDAA